MSLSGETAQPGVVVALGEPSNVNDLLTSAGVQGDIKSLVEDLGEPGLGGLLSPLSLISSFQTRRTGWFPSPAYSTRSCCPSLTAWWRRPRLEVRRFPWQTR